MIPEYNYGFNAATKNALDYLNEIMEQAAAVMLDELARYAGALRPLRQGSLRAT